MSKAEWNQRNSETPIILLIFVTQCLLVLSPKLRNFLSRFSLCKSLVIRNVTRISESSRSPWNFPANFYRARNISSENKNRGEKNVPLDVCSLLQKRATLGRKMKFYRSRRSSFWKEIELGNLSCACISLKSALCLTDIVRKQRFHAQQFNTGSFEVCWICLSLSVIDRAHIRTCTCILVSGFSGQKFRGSPGACMCCNWWISSSCCNYKYR